ncbi:PEP-CTERM sorting domain-containing protein [Allohahella marinimesophila]|uniref:Ice-binding protein C-terminal domain-containing protein n=1 Tax=Allohahella marinimesophila TaxID=1054972 RepID=A0ABP7NWR8_9GAMM
MTSSSIFKGMAATALAVTFSASVSAATIYEAFDQGEVASSCGGAQYGLWTNGLALGSGSACSYHYSINPGTNFTTFDDGTASFTGTATNGYGIEATISLNLFGFTTDYSPVKTGGSANTADWAFYTNLTEDSSITVGGVEYFARLVGAPDNIGTKPVFQYGTGANDKTEAFGGSVWLDMYSANGDALFTEPNHWDINFDLGPGVGLDVPAPSTIGLLALGIAALRLSRQRK